MAKTNFPSGSDYIMNRAVMVVGAHADDNELAVGGALLKYRKLGYDVIYVQSTNNMSGAWHDMDEQGKVYTVAKEGPLDMARRRKAECDAAAKVLGTTPIHLDHPQRHYNGPDGRQARLAYGSEPVPGIQPDQHTILTAYEDKPSVAKLARLILETDPEIIFTHGVAAGNIEHFATSLLVTNAYWQAVDQGFKGGLLHWREAILDLGDINHRWDTHIDITGQLDAKMELVLCHKCQKPDALKPDFGHRRLAIWRGGTCGCGAAEVFTWVNRPSHRNAFGPVLPELTMELLNNSR